jgi:hypothetical protein
MASGDRELIEALLDGDEARWKSAAAALGNERTKHVQIMTFTNACFMQFPEDPSVDDVAAYVRRLREHHLPGADLKLVPTEFLIRGALGEPEIIRGISGEDMAAAHLVVINAVANEHHLVGAPREKFIVEVLDAVD